MAVLAPMSPTAAGPTGLDWVFAARDRLLASARFQRWAAGFPLTRPIARRRARALFDLCAGFVYSQVLTACVRLRVCEILFEAPLDLDTLANRLGLRPDAADRLLGAAVALQLASRRGDGRYALGPLGAALIGNPAIGAMVRHHALLYADLADPERLLRRGEDPNGRTTTALGRYWAYAGAESPAALPANQVEDYTALMAASQPLVADEVLDAYRFHRHRCLLDVGGGDGSFLSAAARRVPRLRVMLFDLPPVAAQAEARFAREGLVAREGVAGRATAFGGDFRTDELPRGADIISLVRVVHDHDDATALALLQAARRALPPGGTLLLAEPMSGTRGAEPVGDAYFAFYLLAMGSGRPRSADALAALLAQAGFDRVRLVPTRQPLLVQVLVARATPAAGL
jgi:demethylspheroidene O-methyltransferase